MNTYQALDFLTANPWAGWLALGLISLILSKKSQVDAWAESKPRVAGVMKILRGLGLDPFVLLQGFSLLVRGRLPEPPKAEVKPKAAPAPEPNP